MYPHADSELRNTLCEQLVALLNSYLSGYVAQLASLNRATQSERHSALEMEYAQRRSELLLSLCEYVQASRPPHSSSRGPVGELGNAPCWLHLLIAQSRQICGIVHQCIVCSKCALASVMRIIQHSRLIGLFTALWMVVAISTNET